MDNKIYRSMYYNYNRIKFIESVNQNIARYSNQYRARSIKHLKQHERRALETNFLSFQSTTSLV